MDFFDDFLSDPPVTSRNGNRFQPKIKPRPGKQNLAPQLSTPSFDKKETVSEINHFDKLSENDKECFHAGVGGAEPMKPSSQLPLVENKGSKDNLFLDAKQSDTSGYLYPTSIHTAKKVNSAQSDLDSCGSILPLHSITDGPVVIKFLTDNTKEVGDSNCSGPSASTAHDAMLLNQSGLGSTQSVDGPSSEGKEVRENVDIFSGQEYFDDYHNKPKNDEDSERLRQSASSNENGETHKERLEIEEAGADIFMEAISTEATNLSGQLSRKYIPKPKMKTAKEDLRAPTSQPEIFVMLPPSSEVISCDTSDTHEASVAAHQPDGIFNDSSIYFDGCTPVNQHTEIPVNVDSLAYDSYSDILVDDFNSDNPDEVSRGVSGLSGKEKPSIESNISQQQERFSQVGEEYEHLKSTRKLRKQVSQLVDDLVASADDKRGFLDEPSNNYDSDGDDYNNVETSSGGSSGGKNACKKFSKPSSKNEKSIRKRKEVNEDVATLKSEKHPKKFSHSTRRSRRQVDTTLLETPEDEIDFGNISFRDLIIYHEYKEKLAKKEATPRRSTANQRTDTIGEEVYDGEEGTHASVQGRGTDDDETHDVVDMTSAYFNYQSFMDKTPRVKWSKQDTQLFYEAVRQFGTDFCMIQQLFPGRTRQQIKLKFKNEERHHPLRLADAMTNRAKDHSHFISLIGQLQEAASKAKHESNEDELTENTGEEVEELSPETNDQEEEVAKDGVKEADINGKEELESGEVHSAVKSDGSDDDDPCRWDDYKFDY